MSSHLLEPQAPLNSHSPSSLNPASVELNGSSNAHAASDAILADGSRSNTPTGFSSLIAEALADVGSLPLAMPSSNYDAKAEPKPSPIPGLSTTPAVQPQYMIFGPDADHLETIIPNRTIHLLPSEPLAKLSARGKKQGVILMMDNYEDFESMTRLKQFLENGTYQPFKPKTALEFVDHQGGGTQPWNPQKDVRIAVHTTETTQLLFMREVDFYLFAIKIHYGQLRKICAENICVKYPKSVKCIWQLVEKVFDVATQVGDDNLVQHITDLVNLNCKEVVALPGYLGLMRAHVATDGQLGRILLESYITASDSLRRKMSELSKKDGTAKTSMRAPARPNADAYVKTEPHAAPPTSPAAANRSLTPNGLRCLDLAKVAQAIANQQLLITLEEGYGTLAHPSLPGRNREFTFNRGELLLVKPSEPSSNGHNNIIVYNSRGERGDILKTLARRIPVTVGVLGKCKFPFPSLVG
jgi:hypothetical protein